MATNVFRLHSVLVHDTTQLFFLPVADSRGNPVNVECRGMYVFQDAISHFVPNQINRINQISVFMDCVPIHEQSWDKLEECGGAKAWVQQFAHANIGCCFQLWRRIAVGELQGELLHCKKQIQVIDTLELECWNGGNLFVAKRVPFNLQVCASERV